MHSHTSSSPRTNLVRRVSHARPVVVLEDQAANDAGLDARLREIGVRAKAQLAVFERRDAPLRPVGAPLPPGLVDKRIARSLIRQARRGELPFWPLINRAESLLRSALSEHVRSRGR